MTFVKVLPGLLLYTFITLQGEATIICFIFFLILVIHNLPIPNLPPIPKCKQPRPAGQSHCPWCYRSGTYVRGGGRGGARSRRRSEPLVSPLPVGGLAEPWGDSSRDAEDDGSDSSSVQSSLDRSASCDESLVFLEQW